MVQQCARIYSFRTIPGISIICESLLYFRHLIFEDPHAVLKDDEAKVKKFREISFPLAIMTTDFSKTLPMKIPQNM